MTRTFARNALFALVTCVACSESPTSPVKNLEKIDVVVGTGAEAMNGRSVTVHYTGWLYSETAASNHGAQFDSSRGRNPITFPLGVGAVIKGWDLGLLGMKAGGRRTLIIPPNMAYGSDGRGAIPPNAALVFDVELVSVQ
jgi:FKBP-type peptidyl-prolyl cis-trans isomerase FkpA